MQCKSISYIAHPIPHQGIINEKYRSLSTHIVTLQKRILKQNMKLLCLSVSSSI